jgi:hypothetical protein
MLSRNVKTDKKMFYGGWNKKKNPRPMLTVFYAQGMSTNMKFKVSDVE